MSGPQLLPTWEQLAVPKPQMVTTMRRYLQQITCVLRPGSVVGTDTTLRTFVAFLIEHAPAVHRVADVDRRHVEDYNPWLAVRPGRTSRG